MTITLNGHTVTVTDRGGSIAVSVDGAHVGDRSTMAGALTLATVATHPTHGGGSPAHVAMIRNGVGGAR